MTDKITGELYTFSPQPFLGRIVDVVNTFDYFSTDVTKAYLQANFCMYLLVILNGRVPILWCVLIGFPILVKQSLLYQPLFVTCLKSTMKNITLIVIIKTYIISQVAMANTLPKIQAQRTTYFVIIGLLLYLTNNKSTAGCGMHYQLVAGFFWQKQTDGTFLPLTGLA